jgi:hypothetical protein
MRSLKAAMSIILNSSRAVVWACSWLSLLASVTSAQTHLSSREVRLHNRKVAAACVIVSGVADAHRGRSPSHWFGRSTKPYKFVGGSLPQGTKYRRWLSVDDLWMLVLRGTWIEILESEYTQDDLDYARERCWAAYEGEDSAGHGADGLDDGTPVKPQSNRRAVPMDAALRCAELGSVPLHGEMDSDKRGPLATETTFFVYDKPTA